MARDPHGIYWQALMDFLSRLQADVASAEVNFPIAAVDRKILSGAKMDLAAWAPILEQWLEIARDERGDEASEILAESLYHTLNAAVTTGSIIRRSETSRKAVAGQNAAAARAAKALRAAHSGDAKAVRGRLIDDTIRALVTRWRSDGRPCKAAAVLVEVNAALDAEGFEPSSEATVRRRLGKISVTLSE